MDFKPIFVLHPLMSLDTFFLLHTPSCTLFSSLGCPCMNRSGVQYFCDLGIKVNLYWYFIALAIWRVISYKSMESQ